jgi:hypothetical protein
VQTFTRTGEACQEFRIDPVGDVLIGAGAGVLSGCRGPVVSVERRAGACQLWRFVHTDGGYFQVVNVTSGRQLTMRRHVLVLGDRPGPTAQWRLEPLGGGDYRLVNRAGETARAGAFQLLVP